MPRPSSPLSAKASTKCPFHTQSNQPNPNSQPGPLAGTWRKPSTQGRRIQLTPCGRIADPGPHGPRRSPSPVSEDRGQLNSVSPSPWPSPRGCDGRASGDIRRHLPSVTQIGPGITPIRDYPHPGLLPSGIAPGDLSFAADGGSLFTMSNSTARPPEGHGNLCPNVRISCAGQRAAAGHCNGCPRYRLP